MNKSNDELEEGRKRALEISGGKHSKDMTTDEIINTVRQAYPSIYKESEAEKMERLNDRRCGW